MISRMPARSAELRTLTNFSENPLDLRVEGLLPMICIAKKKKLLRTHSYARSAMKALLCNQIEHD